MSALVALAAAYAQEHPIEVARLLESVDAPARATLLEALDERVAARVLAEATPRFAAQALGQLSEQTAARVVAQLEPRVAAGLLMRLSEQQAAAVLVYLPQARSAQLRSLLQYGPARAGGRLDPRAIGVPETLAVAQTLQWLLREPEGVSHYVYALGEGQQLTGVVSLRELLGAASDASIETIMVRDPERLRADDMLERIASHPAWRRVHALPVVDAGNRFMGVLRYSAFRSIEIELGQASSGADPTRSASALAELYGLSAGALLQWASNALMPAVEPKKEPRS